MTDVPTTPRPAMPVAPEAPKPAPQPQSFYAQIAQREEPKPRKKAKRKTRIQNPPVTRRKKTKRTIARNRRSVGLPAGPYAFRNQAPKNPNRPLELKTTLSTVLRLLPDMKKPETDVFTTVMEQMQALSRSGRRRVLTALGQVYP